MRQIVGCLSKYRLPYEVLDFLPEVAYRHITGIAVVILEGQVNIVGDIR